MYERASEKLMMVINIATGIGIAGCVISGVILMFTGELFFFVGLLVAVLGSLAVWLSGLVTATIAEIGVNLKIVVAKLSLQTTSDDTSKLKSALQNAGKPSNQPVAGGWTCTCGRNNAGYVSTCPCGTNRREIVK